MLSVLLLLVSFLLFGCDEPVISTYTISGNVVGATHVTIVLGGLESWTTATNSEGDYSFTNLREGSYTLTPTKEGYYFSPVTRSVALSDHESTGNNFTASLPATYSIAGTVVGAAGVTVTLGGDAAQAVVTKSNGHYAFSSLSDGDYTVTPSEADYSFSPATKSVAINHANSTNNNFSANRFDTYSISGIITGADSVKVTLGGDYSAVTITNADGYYSFGHLSNGNYTLTPAESGYEFSPTSRSVTINNASSTANNFVATAPTTYSLLGKVSGADNVTLTLAGDTAATTSTDGSEHYAFNHLSNGTYSITPSKTGFGFSPSSRTLTISDESITGNNFAASSAGLYSISGYVTGADSVTVSLRDQVVSTTTGADGYYAFHHLPAGSYTLVPQKTGYDFSPSSQTEVITNTSTTEINFAASSLNVFSISGKISGLFRYHVLVTLSGEASQTYRTDANGHYAFHDLSDGNYTVTPTRSFLRRFVPTARDITINGASSTGNDFHIRF